MKNIYTPVTKLDVKNFDRDRTRFHYYSGKKIADYKKPATSNGKTKTDANRKIRKVKQENYEDGYDNESRDGYEDDNADGSEESDDNEGRDKSKDDNEDGKEIEANDEDGDEYEDDNEGRIEEEDESEEGYDVEDEADVEEDEIKDNG